MSDLREDGLTMAEGEVMDHLHGAVSAWDELPIQHPNDVAEFYSAIHKLQDLLAVRIARRDYSVGWPTHG